ncbi:MAG: hypothetical protein ACJ8AW_11910 [Rhodopila sp.]
MVAELAAGIRVDSGTIWSASGRESIIVADFFLLLPSAAAKLPVRPDGVGADCMASPQRTPLDRERIATSTGQHQVIARQRVPPGIGSMFKPTPCPSTMDFQLAGTCSFSEAQPFQLWIFI